MSAARAIDDDGPSIEPRPRARMALSRFFALIIRRRTRRCPTSPSVWPRAKIEYAFLVAAYGGANQSQDRRAPLSWRRSLWAIADTALNDNSRISDHGDEVSGQLHFHRLIEYIQQHHKAIALIHIDDRRHKAVEDSAREPHRLAGSIRA